MKKKDFVTLIMSTGGGNLFALGMCMALLPALSARLSFWLWFLSAGRWTASRPSSLTARRSVPLCSALSALSSSASACA